jgi:deoxyribodipyrimidine photo-lyase
MLETRVHLLNDTPPRPRPVIYWMSRDQRIRDNWALVYAQRQALELKVPLVIVFCLVPEFLGATIRHYDFMLQGLEMLEKKSAKMNIPFILLTGNPSNEIPRVV